jgi:hypothetical protein
LHWKFGNDDPVKEMISLAAINAICQHVMRDANFPVNSATDSLGLLSVSAEDRLGTRNSLGMASSIGLSPAGVSLTSIAVLILEAVLDSACINV